MKRKISFFMGLALVLTVFFTASPAFAQIADGTYEINYEMKESSSENTSIANGYFSKPGKLTVKNGVQTITLTVTGADMIKRLAGPSGNLTVLSEDSANNSRVVQFRANGDLSNPINIEMDIDVPDLYEMTHTARMVISNADSFPQAPASDPSDSTSETAASGEVVDNPKTGENSPFMLYALLMVGAVAGLIAIRKLRPAQN